jgi:hypothetical protein
MKRTQLVILAIGLFFFMQAAHADWTPSKRITWTSGNSWPGGIVVAPSGSVHVVWDDDTTGVSQIYYKKSTDGGATWAASQRLTWSSTGSQSGAIAVDSTGRLHVIWVELLGPWPYNEEIYYRMSTDAGNTWTSSRRLTWTSDDSSRPEMASYSSAGVHVVWQDYSTGDWDIYYKKSTDGGDTWTSSKRLTWSSAGTWNPSIAMDSSGNPHVVWDDTTPGNGEIYYKNSPDGGAAWTSSQRLTWNSGTSAFPAIAVDPSDNLHVVWFDNTPGNFEIYYRMRPYKGAPWKASQRLTWNSGTSSGPRVAADSFGHLHVVWSDNTPGNEEIYWKTSADGGASWSVVQRLTSNSGDSESPRIVVDSSDNLHVIWDDNTPGNYEIYYKKLIK